MSDLPLLLAVIVFTIVVAVGLMRVCVDLSRRSEALHKQVAARAGK